MYYVYVSVCMRGKVCVGGCAHVHAYVKLVQTCHTVCGGKRTTFGSLPSLWELGTALSLSGYMTSILSTELHCQLLSMAFVQTGLCCWAQVVLLPEPCEVFLSLKSGVTLCNVAVSWMWIDFFPYISASWIDLYYLVGSNCNWTWQLMHNREVLFYICSPCNR